MQAAIGGGARHAGVDLAVRRVAVEEQLKKANTGALAGIWQRQQEKEQAWMRSLLEGQHSDPDYQSARKEVAKMMGLRAEEVRTAL